MVIQGSSMKKKIETNRVHNNLGPSSSGYYLQNSPSSGGGKNNVK